MTSVLQRAAGAVNAANAHSEVRSSARHEETELRKCKYLQERNIGVF